MGPGPRAQGNAGNAGADTSERRSLAAPACDFQGGRARGFTEGVQDGWRSGIPRLQEVCDFVEDCGYGRSQGARAEVGHGSPAVAQLYLYRFRRAIISSEPSRNSSATRVVSRNRAAWSGWFVGLALPPIDGYFALSSAASAGDGAPIRSAFLPARRRVRGGCSSRARERFSPVRRPVGELWRRRPDELR